jgi:preprotein translocase subunit YajC
MLELSCYVLAQASGGETQNGGLLPLLGPIVIFGVMIYFMIRSQRKQAKKRQEMIDHVKKGDDVVIAGGIFGKVIEVKEKTFMVEIAEKVNVEVSKPGVTAIFSGGKMDTIAN